MNRQTNMKELRHTVSLLTEYDENYNINRMGFYTSIFLTVITLITFGFDHLKVLPF